MSGELTGRLRERVTIERRDMARDALGGASGSWVAVRSAWAEVAPAGLGVFAVADTRSAMPYWSIMLRSIIDGDDVRIGDRVLWRGRILKVRAIEADPRLPDRITLNTEEER